MGNHLIITRQLISPAFVSLALIFLLITLTFSKSTSAQDTAIIEFAFAGDADSDAYLGAKQGLDEGNVQGQFMGLTYKLVPLTDGSQPRAIVSAVAADVISDVVDSYSSVPIINVTVADDSLRAACSENLFHTTPQR